MDGGWARSFRRCVYGAHVWLLWLVWVVVQGPMSLFVMGALEIAHSLPTVESTVLAGALAGQAFRTSYLLVHFLALHTLLFPWSYPAVSCPMHSVNVNSTFIARKCETWPPTGMAASCTRK